MSHLKLISVNSEPAQKFETDNLIESVFTFISKYCGQKNNLNSAYSTALLLFEDLTCIANLPTTTPVYIPNEQLWEKRINTTFIKIIQKPILLGGEILKKITELSNYYAQLSIQYPHIEIPHLTPQEVFSYANYLFLEDFLNHLEGNDTMSSFPPIIKTLQRKDLETELLESLHHTPNLIFLANPHPEPHFHIKI